MDAELEFSNGTPKQGSTSRDSNKMQLKSVSSKL